MVFMLGRSNNNAGQVLKIGNDYMCIYICVCVCEICKTAEVVESWILTAVCLFFRLSSSSSLISGIIKEMSGDIFSKQAYKWQD